MRRLSVSVLRQIKIFIATKVTVILRERALTNHSANVIIASATFLRKSKSILYKMRTQLEKEMNLTNHKFFFIINNSFYTVFIFLLLHYA